MSSIKDELTVSEHPVEEAYGQSMEKGLQEPGSVALKYRGTEADKRDMSALGKKQVLRVCSLNHYVSPSYVSTNGLRLMAIDFIQRNFKFITMLGFASTVVASWEVVLP